MITKISMQDHACYGDTPQDIYDLKKFNFIFGANGSGKTTISKLIADESCFPESNCSITWNGGTKLDALVYNTDFVNNNFVQPSELKGIFTLGEENKEIIGKIESLKSEVDNFNKEILILKKNLNGDGSNNGKVYEMEETERTFEDTCWKLKQNHDEKLKGAFTGFRNSKVAFKNELLRQFESNTAKLVPLSEIEEKAETVYGKSPELASPIPALNYEKIISLETHSILKKKVVGKADVDIAKMIQKLDNSDWVKQGRSYYDTNNYICPFCQQTTDKSFAEKLNAYFDEAFEQDTKLIEELRINYRSESDHLLQYLQNIIESPSSFIAIDKLKSERDLLSSKIDHNLLQISNKQREPSRIIELYSLLNILLKIKEYIDNANELVGKHNQTVNNLKEEKANLTEQVWKFLLEKEIKTELAVYKAKSKGLLKAIENLTDKINSKTALVGEKEASISKLEKSSTSIKPTIDQINNILKIFEFDSFRLHKSDKENYYKIVRPDGTGAKETLSEGEKSFIVFLYFYHLLRGSTEESGTTSDRVVVFDDPVSSLDSNVLFVVSALIRDLIVEVRRDNSYIKQIIFLTHNVYFHKEVTFNLDRKHDGCLPDETFWLLRKTSDSSLIKKQSCNPIKTSYELLWVELRDTDSPSVLSIQNTMRRILEYYFKILGGLDFNTICSCFAGKEKIIVNSLFSWINAGSHLPDDDAYLFTDFPSKDVYMSVFKEIFTKTGHDAHYKMMMHEEEEA